MILVLVEVGPDGPDATSLEAVALARRLADAAGGRVDAVAFGARAATVAAGLAGLGLRTLHVADADRLDAYAPAAWGAALAELAGTLGAEAVVGPGTDRGNEVVAHAAARLGAGFAANCTDAAAGDPLVLTRLRWGGSLLEDAELGGAVPCLTVAPHTVAARAPDPAAGHPEVVAFAPSITDADLRGRVTAHVAPEADRVSLEDARVVVGGGRGVGSAEGFAPLEELAGLLGGVVGVSRVVTSNGWRPHTEQVGQTGARIAPDLYIACGISGAIQHIVGARGAKRMLAINTDPDAPMVQRATWAVIGDLHAVVPAISAEIRRVGVERK